MRNLIRTTCFAAAAILGLAAVPALAGHHHGDHGNHGGHGGYYGHQRNHMHWRSSFHDTSHWDYQPGYHWRHGDHFHYQPGRHVWHQTGHWH